MSLAQNTGKNALSALGQRFGGQREMDDNMSDFVRRLRRQLGMTQEEFAHALGITVGTVNRWENGRFRPSKLARATIMDFARRHGVASAPASPDNGNMLKMHEEPFH
jgi:putative transcriptional regulator